MQTETPRSVALHEDAALLADEPYVDWAIEPRERLDLLRQNARLQLARDRTRGQGCSEPNAIIDAWEACLVHDPALEEAAIALISAYAVQGRRKLIARTFDRCRDGLRDLGLEPTAALVRAYQIASGATAERPAPWSVDDFEAASNLPTSLSSFVGREVEQADVCSLVRSAASRDRGRGRRVGQDTPCPRGRQAAPCRHQTGLFCRTGGYFRPSSRSGRGCQCRGYGRAARTTTP